MKYDVAVIGAGLGGLLCGSILAKEGFNVCVIEKNPRVGGCLQSFSRDGAVFDTGIHYVGSLDKGQVLERCFSYLGMMDSIKIQKMNQNAFDIISFGDDSREYPYAMGYENYIEKLSAIFPAERKGIKAYVDELIKINNCFPINSLRASDSNFIPPEYINTSVGDFIKTFTSDKTLLSVLCGTNLLYAGLPDRTPVYVHALVVHSYIISAYRLIGGADQVASFLSESVENSGGVVMRNAPVNRFVHGSDGKIIHVETLCGEKIEADNFISSIHPSETVKMIDRSILRKAYYDRMTSLENTVSVFSLYAVMKNGAMNYSGSNYYHYRDENVWAREKSDDENWPGIFFMSETAMSEKDTYAKAVNVLCYMDYDETKKWENSKSGRRCDEYEEFKQSRARSVIKSINRRFPGFEDKIESYYTASPLTYRNYTNTVNGSIYGIFRDCNDLLKSHVSPRSKIPNLYFAGQNVTVHGMMGVMKSSLMTCGIFTGLDYLMSKINAE